MSAVQLSIIVPTYNRLPDLQRVVGQLQRMLRPPGLSLEILISDNSTEDDTQRWVEREQLSGMTYHRNARNLGQYNNCNLALQRAQGEWVQILHDDDEITPDYLQALAPYLSDPGLVLVTGRSIFMGTNAAQVQQQHDLRIQRLHFTYPARLNGQHLFTQTLQLGCPFIISHSLMRRQTVLAAGSFREQLRYTGDFDLWLRMMMRGDFQLVDAVMGNYHLHPGNQISTRKTRWAMYMESYCHALYYLAPLHHYDPAGASAFRQELSKEVPKLRFISGQLLRNPSLSRRLDTLLQRHRLQPRTTPASLPYMLLNALPANLGGQLYRGLIKTIPA
ncbi:glycosyltransferase family 2 protein [Hymenobacter psychrotolerans]|uniref:Glycosyltransferase, GT2 family n=1 Tax=Hymenobacter psychrotolerans DSM 18569 TaxID=1121959 RepID=A0A1M6W4Y2_9BACT|nr:glycosyltransferase family 2 protein [Hymenobacter psychrotolerans]SHK88821.1 Glycosyltransferase, GT2 family [Hymenobacter psychrotolerans DSM 18569]